MVTASLTLDEVLDTRPNLTKFALSIAVTHIVFSGGEAMSKAFRGTYAGIGYLWDAANNIFHAPKPYASWILDTATARWHSPIGDAPDDLTDEEKAVNTYYAWNDANGSWDKTTPAA